MVLPAEEDDWTCVTLRPRLVFVALLEAVAEEEVEVEVEVEVVEDKAAEWRASGVAATDHRRDEVSLPLLLADLPPLLPVLRGLAMMHVRFGGH